MKILYENRCLVIDSKLSGRGSKESRRYLVVSDLHVGFEDKFRVAGISVESNVNSMAEELNELISKRKVTNLIIDGDVKSSTDRISRAEWENIPKLFEKIPSSCEITIIPGNHDGGLEHLLPKNIEIADASGIMVDGNLILHGHTRPLPKFSFCRRLIIGHLHPIFQERGSPISGQPVWVFLRVNRKSIFESLLESEGEEENEISLLEVVIMPSFNKDLVVAGYARDAAKSERRVAPVLKALREANEAIITTLSGEIIGDSSILPRIL